MREYSQFKDISMEWCDFMEKLHFSIVVDAPKQKVWEVLLGKDTYPLWTDVFMPGSYSRVIGVREVRYFSLHLMSRVKFPGRCFG